MRDVWFIFASIFCAGIVSLLLELSLLREFIYIFGSTAVSNALIISFFLGGLAVGAYLGTERRLLVASESEARSKYAFIQFLNILFVVVFYISKKYFIYDCPYPYVVKLYFLGSVLAPSLLSGLGYALSVKIMHWRGEKFITYIYAFSTLGSVIGGLAHGLILVPLWGMRSAYLCAVMFAGLALYTIHPMLRRVHKAAVALTLLLAVLVITWNVADAIFPSKNILFSKDSDFGIVEVWRLSKEDALYKHLALGGEANEFRVDGEAIDLKVNSTHQSFNLQIDRNIHEQWATTSLEIVNRPAKVLLLGFGSGVTAVAFLKSPLVERLDIVENCAPLVEAAQMFFSPEFEYVERSPKVRNIIDDFRGYVRFADEKYDIIAMDHSIEDPYAIGFFTVEFFDQLKRISKPGAVVIMLGKGLSWNTTRISFKYLYKNIDPRIEPALRFGCLYMSQKEFTGPAAGNYKLITEGLRAQEDVYSDDVVRPLTESEMTKHRPQL
jgi:spermidine synthase